MKNIIVFIISIFFSVQVFAQSEDSQDVTPTDQTAKTSLAGEYIYADSYFKKSKTGVLLKWLPTTGPTVFYGWRFVVYNTEKFFIGGTGFTGQYGGPEDYGTLTAAGMTAGWDFTIFDDVYVDWGLSAGGVGGRNAQGSTTIEEGGVLVEPWFGFNHKLGENTDFNYSFSLWYAPNSKTYNGSVAFNMRVDFIIN